MKNLKSLIVITGILVLATSWQPAKVASSRADYPAAGPWYVAIGGNDSNDCLAPATPCATINAAIGKANPGDTVYVAEGTYTGEGSEVVWIDKDIILSSGWNGDFTLQNGMSTINGEGSRLESRWIMALSLILRDSSSGMVMLCMVEELRTMVIP